MGVNYWLAGELRESLTYSSLVVPHCVDRAFMPPSDGSRTREGIQEFPSGTTGDQAASEHSPGLASREIWIRKLDSLDNIIRDQMLGADFTHTHPVPLGGDSL